MAYNILTSAYRTLRGVPAFRQVRLFTSVDSMQASEVVERSPYEELQVELDNKSCQENPMKINAYGDERTVACVCDDMHFITLKKGPPMKCKCGFWFKLVDANKFWEG